MIAGCIIVLVEINKLSLEIELLAKKGSIDGDLKCLSDPDTDVIGMKPSIDREKDLKVVLNDLRGRFREMEPSSSLIEVSANNPLFVQQLFLSLAQKVRVDPHGWGPSVADLLLKGTGVCHALGSQDLD
jgi:hypothetical protein